MNWRKGFGSVAGFHLREHKTVQRRLARSNSPFIRFNRDEIKQSITDRFEQQVARNPDHMAVRTEHHEWSYGKLNQAANRVARAVLASPKEEEKPIGLLLENDAPTIAAVLGVLKAGKIYVPLDPHTPPARTSYILRDSRTSLLVTDNRNLSLAEELARAGIELLNIDELDSSLSTENLDLAIPPETPSWILYTSGSNRETQGGRSEPSQRSSFRNELCEWVPHFFCRSTLPSVLL